MANKSAKKYSLQITISALFISISLVLGIILSWQSFNKTSDIMLNAADGLHERIAHELVLDFKASYGPIVGRLRQFRAIFHVLVLIGSGCHFVSIFFSPG